MEILEAVKNKYNGIYIIPEKLPGSENEFNDLLTLSIEQWKSEGLKVVWLKISSAKSNLIQIAVKNGFQYHHCTPDELMLVKRIISDAELPSYANHTIGAGGVVLNNKEEILTIVEQADIIKKPDHYKFPGGMLERGENIQDGVIREVFEETGIQTKFNSLLGFRHHHKGQFNTSNIYFVCLLEPLTFEIKKDNVEIAKAEWMPVKDYLCTDGVGLLNKHIVKSIINSSCFYSVKIDDYMHDANDYEIYSSLKT